MLPLEDSTIIGTSCIIRCEWTRRRRTRRTWTSAPTSLLAIWIQRFFFSSLELFLCWSNSPQVDEKLLYDTFSAFGVILTTPKIQRDPETGNSKGFAFINYASFEASDAAIEAMNGQYLCNRCQCNLQGAHCVHYSLIFIVYTILYTICTLLKLYTIGYIAGSGGKNKGYRFKMSQLSSITRMEDDR